MLACCLFKPTVEPVKECSLPEYTVLWLQHPVVLVGEDEQLCLNTLHAGCIECRHALGGIDAIVFFTVYTQDGSVPFVDEFVRTVLVSLLGIACC